MRSISKFSTVSCKLWQLTLGLVMTCMSVHAMAQSIVMSSTTSTEQSGLFGFLLPEFKKATGIDTKVVALGTGQALDMARRGDADVVFVHDQPAEEKFVAEGFGIKRFPVMYNDFVVVGPQADPANAKGNDIVAALKKIAASNAAFISRGDKSGTHAAEIRFWNAKCSHFIGRAATAFGLGPCLGPGTSTFIFRRTYRQFGPTRQTRSRGAGAPTHQAAWAAIGNHLGVCQSQLGASQAMGQSRHLPRARQDFGRLAYG
jgi:tungstate transport system substrate-binding protein